LIKGLLIALAAAAGLFCVVGVLLPPGYDIIRSREIKAHPIKVYLWVGELRSWPQWWPWTDLGPAAKFSFGPKTSGVGSTAGLQGRPGAAKVTVTEASPTGGIAFDYSFDSGAGQGRCSMETRVSGEVTNLTWRCQGRFATPVLGGYLAALADPMHGGMLDWGLKRLKDLVEADKREVFGDPASP
jgi:hypothetical protein